MFLRSLNMIRHLRGESQERSRHGTAYGVVTTPTLRGMALALGVLVAGGTSALAQDSGDWRTRFAAGEEARKAGDVAGYLREMSAAVQAMPADLGNRPFAQYHAARAAALAGDADEAARWLDMAWEEEIESLMITFADHDPAFDEVRDDPAVREVLGRPASMDLDVRQLASGVYLLDGAGSKVVASVGADGVLLVDTGYGAAMPALRRALRGLGHERVDVLVLTHPHEDHWGGVAALGDEATVLAHPAAAVAMDEPYVFMEGVEVPPKLAVAHPDAVSRDTTFRFNGQTVHIVPFEAHTGADVAVWLAGSRVLHMGDAYLGGNPLMFPGGEDPKGFLKRMDAFLAELPAGTVVVGGHDEPTDVKAVRDQIADTWACIDLVERALSEGATLDETVARAEGRFTAPWVRYFYGVLGEGAGGSA